MHRRSSSRPVRGSSAANRIPRRSMRHHVASRRPSKRSSQRQAQVGLVPRRHFWASYTLPQHENEKPLHYAPNSPERAEITKSLQRVRNEVVDIPVVIGGKQYFTDKIIQQTMPSDHRQAVANVHQATPELVTLAVETAQKAQHDWAAMPAHHRAMIFRRAADLVATKHRSYINAVTMLGTGKNVWQADIDSAQELADFFRFNAKYAEQLAQQQPPLNSPGVWNRQRYRPLEGVVATISPFNFCAIGANLNAAPAIMGNVTVWKPSYKAALENYVSYQIMEEAGLPPGVINFVPAGHKDFNRVFDSEHFAGLHFTGSSEVFGELWQHTGRNLHKYRSYPRLVGETGGKNFHVIHPSADLRHTVLNTLRAAFEYQGQKCSACSRVYLPKSLHTDFRDMLAAEIATIKIGQPDEFDSFMTAVISKEAAQKHANYFDSVRHDAHHKFITGGKVHTERGWFVEPTVIETTDPHAVGMKTEFFGPIINIFVYDDSKPNAWENVLRLADSTSQYALTGAVFANDRSALVEAEAILANACGNLYLNDKSTGAVVGQQPFGGSRLSGTNDKAGSMFNLIRWTSPQAIKENSLILDNYGYPHMQ